MSVCVGGALICDWHPYKDKGIWKQRHTCGGETMGRQSRDWGDTAASQGTPRVAAATRNPESGLLQILPRAIEGDVAPPAPGFQTSSFQNYEKINLCCLKPPSLW